MRVRFQSVGPREVSVVGAVRRGSIAVDTKNAKKFPIGMAHAGAFTTDEMFSAERKEHKWWASVSRWLLVIVGFITLAGTGMAPPFALAVPLMLLGGVWAIVNGFGAWSLGMLGSGAIIFAFAGAEKSKYA